MLQMCHDWTDWMKEHTACKALEGEDEEEEEEEEEDEEEDKEDDGFVLL